MKTVTNVEPLIREPSGSGVEGVTTWNFHWGCNVPRPSSLDPTCISNEHSKTSNVISQYLFSDLFSKINAAPF